MVESIPLTENIEELRKENEWFKKKYGSCIKNRGVRNWKNLFRKPTLLEWTILFMVIMALFIAWAYQRDIALCREYIEQVNSNFTFLDSNLTCPPCSTINFSNINFSMLKEDNVKVGEG